ncbi:uncharacterized protein LOC118686146 isoform X1 [Molothrus ater]|uniref:uncharacterized protein LOC118686146 isoform X1 n=1 Tax=Molothrus ater TaxID=84834 RepID=UPI00174C6607|nr:uncharacterized protein LOC118686146 isoform X1 [Molothrus ater]XP_036238063.2 uncharacterized protein LOC118686146 isoform X1 [Molothrus ater]XP_054370593.1 uncharacterized protein LOC118686146 isoform X1 [Molothrus ater]XP_054370594.1 uncharacterized protein LOC118686146 isoform X1 [Molothrus ater]
MRLQRASRGAASGWRKAKGPTRWHQGTCEEQNGHLEATWRKGMHSFVFSTPPVAPTWESFPSLLHFQLDPWKTPNSIPLIFRCQRHEGAAAFQELLASSCPALPASWDTAREHQGAWLAASRRHRGPWARKTALAPAASIVWSWQHSPAGNAPRHSPEELWPRSKVTLRACLVRFFLGKQRDIVGAHLQLLGKSWQGQNNQGYGEEFGAAMLSASQFCPTAIAGAAV